MLPRGSQVRRLQCCRHPHVRPEPALQAELARFFMTNSGRGELRGIRSFTPRGLISRSVTKMRQVDVQCARIVPVNGRSPAISLGQRAWEFRLEESVPAGV